MCRYNSTDIIESEVVYTIGELKTEYFKDKHGNFKEAQSGYNDDKRRVTAREI